MCSQSKTPFIHSKAEKFSFLCLILCITQGCVFTRDINKAMLISDATETGTIQINSAPARGPDHFPFHVKYLSSILLSSYKNFEGCNTNCKKHFLWETNSKTFTKRKKRKAFLLCSHTTSLIDEFNLTYITASA